MSALGVCSSTRRTGKDEDALPRRSKQFGSTFCTYILKAGNAILTEKIRDKVGRCEKESGRKWKRRSAPTNEKVWERTKSDLSDLLTKRNWFARIRTAESALRQNTANSDDREEEEEKEDEVEEEEKEEEEDDDDVEF